MQVTFASAISYIQAAHASLPQLKLFYTLQSPQVFLQDASQEVSELPADTFASAGAVLEVG